MKFIQLTAFMVVLTLVSCKRNYECECTSSQGTYISGEVEKTKSQAKKYCKNELSRGETTCKLKE